MITSIQNSKVKKISALLEKKGRKEQHAFLIEGMHLVFDAVKLEYPLDEIFVAESKYDGLVSKLANAKCEITVVADNVFAKIANTENSQGIVAIAKMIEYDKFNSNSRFLVLDHIQDPGNMGTIIRSAVATGFETIVCLNCVDVFNPKVVRSTSSGIFGAKFYFFDYDDMSVIAENTPLLVASAEGDNLFEISDIPSSFGLVIGNEANGVSSEMKKLGRLVALPMKPVIESLNAGVCASVMMFLLTNGKF